MYTFKLHVQKKPYKPTEGEEFLMDFFQSEDIKYQCQVEIIDLKDDNCLYRIADFYLPEYKVFVEFFGNYNTDYDKRKAYDEKKNVYIKNNVPCLYFYPENLGFIHYSFRKRLRVELKKHSLKKELFHYNLRLLIADKAEVIVWFILCAALLIMFQFDRTAKLYWLSCGVVGSFLIFLGYRIIVGYNKIFKKEYSYITFMRD